MTAEHFQLLKVQNLVFYFCCLGRVADSFPQHCQPVIQNLLCGMCQRPLKEIGGNVSTKGGDLRLRCQYCFHEN